MSPIQFSRRSVIQIGAASLAAAAVASNLSSASAAPLNEPQVTDLGPAVVQFSLMSATLVGETLYIGSRNLDPVKIIGLHVPTGRVTRSSVLGTGHSIQSMAADPSGRYLYAGVLQSSTGPQPNLYRWDLTTPETPAQAIGRIGDRDVRHLSVSPDGRLYAVGGGSGTAPALWEYDPATGQVVNLGVPDAKATLARAVAATETTVFFGAGSTLGGGGNVSRACLYAYDRAAKTFTQVTPAEMLPDPSIRDLAVAGDRLLVGSAASTEAAKVASMDLADLTSYDIATSIGKTAKNFSTLGEGVYFANEAGICRYSREAGSVEQITLTGPSLGEIWGVARYQGGLLVTSGYGFVASIDPATGASTQTDLTEAGAPAGAQVVMGIAAGAGYAYAGGNGVIARHKLLDRSVLNLQAPGEAKDAVIVGGTLYTGQYNSQGIWAHDPGSGESIKQVATFPGEQNRPQDVCWDDVNKLVLVAAQADTEGGGSLWTYDPRTHEKTCRINPIDAQQYLRAVATREGVAYVGGSLQGTTGPGTVVALNPVTGEELWRQAPLPGASISALATRGKHLYGLTRKGGFFVIDVTTQKIVHTADIRTVGTGFMALVTNRGVVYAASETNVFCFDPKTFAVSVVLADTKGGWYSGSHIVNDEQGFLYTLRERNLVRINDIARG